MKISDIQLGTRVKLRHTSEVYKDAVFLGKNADNRLELFFVEKLLCFCN